jgi:hypothetical protein
LLLPLLVLLDALLLLALMLLHPLYRLTLVGLLHADRLALLHTNRLALLHANRLTRRRSLRCRSLRCRTSGIDLLRGAELVIACGNGWLCRHRRRCENGKGERRKACPAKDRYHDITPVCALEIKAERYGTGVG